MQIEQAIPYLVKLADWAAGQGFCQIEGIQDPEEWIMEAWDALGEGWDYTPEALAAALSARPDDSAVERVAKRLLDHMKANVSAGGFVIGDIDDAAIDGSFDLRYAVIAALGGE